MSIQPFDPKFMKVGVLTAALQELTPRAVRDPDPDRAIEEWVEFAKELAAVNPGGGYEIRPVIYFAANDELADSATMPNASA